MIRIHRMIVLGAVLAISLAAAGCGRLENEAREAKTGEVGPGEAKDGEVRPGEVMSGELTSGEWNSDKVNFDLHNTAVTPGQEIIRLEEGLSAVRYDGDYGFDQFLEQGGASSDGEVVKFLTDHLLAESGLGFLEGMFGCSTISVESPEGERLFGRNFDWQGCNAMIVQSVPENGYASVSTVNTDFIRTGGAGSLADRSEKILTLASLYAPLDGMNEKGLCVSVNMIQDSAVISQNTGKPDLTTTTAIRLLLNQAADVEEAIGLLEQYDLHSSMGMMVHFALADAGGRSVAAEYVDNELIVTETPVVTNFYLAKGRKNGIGTAQSYERYALLMSRLEETETMDMEGVRDALDSVSKDNFGEFESTEWSIVFNQATGKIRYYHREDYQNSYTFTVR